MPPHAPRILKLGIHYQTRETASWTERAVWLCVLAIVAWIVWNAL